MTSLSPLDGRYAHYTNCLRELMSEKSYVMNRMIVEMNYLNALLSKLGIVDISKLKCIMDNFTDEDFAEYKLIETKIKHDVKAIEIFLRSYIKKYDPTFCHEEYIHYGLTSQDANSLGFMIGCKDGLTHTFQILHNLTDKIYSLVETTNDIKMITRTHGQPAVSSVLGKEIYVHYFSIMNSLMDCSSKSKNLTVKFGGAIGNMNALTYVHPDIDWLEFADAFVDTFGFTRSKYTTQVDDYGNLCEMLYSLILMNQKVIRMINYIWDLISDEYFVQKPVDDEVGSSTMPNKINPINFENAKGNLTLANSMLTGICDVLMRLTYQRDMSDSTVLRSLGSAFGYIVISYNEIIVGVDKLKPNLIKIEEDMNKYAIVIMEGIQTYLKHIGCKEAYELAKTFSRRSDIIITLDDIRKNFIDKLDILSEHVDHLNKLTPHSYIGVYPELKYIKCEIN